MLKRKREDILEKVTFFRQYLLNHFKNQKLQQEILDMLDHILDGTYRVINCTPKSIAIELPNKDTYTFSMNNSNIETYFSEYSKSKFTKKTITYIEDLILVSIDESSSEIDTLTTLPAMISRSSEKRVYKNGELTYQLYFTSLATSSLNTYNSITESDEILVDPDKMAMKRYIRISNEDNNVPQIRYYRCNHFYSAPWNTVDNHYIPMANTLTECGEQAFYSFRARLNKTPKEQLLKK